MNAGANGPFYGGGGSVTIKYKLKRQAYNRKYFGLEVDGSVVDFISLEGTSAELESNYEKIWFPRPSGQTSTYFGVLQNMAAGDGSVTGPGLTVISNAGFTSNSNSTAKIQPEIAGMGPFSVWSTGYQATSQADSIAEKIRNLYVNNVNDQKAWVKPFVRIEANNLISFNIGDSGFSVGTIELISGSTFPIRYQELASGTHFKRTVYKMDGGGLLANTYAANPNPENPAFNIAGGLYNCTYNSETEEAVVNSEYNCSYV
jgi:hypothetical protein